MQKRKIIKIDEDKCNGCGLCILGCQEGVLKIIDGKARLVNSRFCDGLGACIGSCPQGAITIEEVNAGKHNEYKTEPIVNTDSHLRQWPVQMSLVPVNAPYFNGAHLLIAADCVPFAYPDFHGGLLKGKVLLVGCPKLDDVASYRDKLSQIVKSNDIRSITYAHMEVPCCFGLVDPIKQAIAGSGKDIPFEDVTVSIKGEISK